MGGMTAGVFQSNGVTSIAPERLMLGELDKVISDAATDAPRPS